MQMSRRNEEPRAPLFLDEPKQEKEDTRTLKEPAHADVYIPHNETMLQTRSGRTVRTNQFDDMLYYK